VKKGEEESIVVSLERQGCREPVWAMVKKKFGIFMQHRMIVSYQSYGTVLLEP
jgi:hypothetical protein